MYSKHPSPPELQATEAQEFLEFGSCLCVLPENISQDLVEGLGSPQHV